MTWDCPNCGEIADENVRHNETCEQCGECVGPCEQPLSTKPQGDPCDVPAFPTALNASDPRQAGVLHLAGMSLREYAAIHLRVPNSGTDWLNEMIRQSRRDWFAGQALDSLIQLAHRDTINDTMPVRKSTIARWAREIADCLIAELDQLPDDTGENGGAS